VRREDVIQRRRFMRQGTVAAEAAVGAGLGLSLASAPTALGIAWTSSRRHAATAVVQAEATRRAGASP
jgi:hypothetical protein